MLSVDTQKITDRVIAERIALLIEIIRTGNQESAMRAAFRLGSMETKHSDQVAIELFGEIPESAVRDMFSGKPWTYWPNGTAIREKLKELRKDDTNFDTTSTSTKIDPRLLAAPPLWQVIAEALETEFAQQLRTAERAANTGILYTD